MRFARWLLLLACLTLTAHQAWAWITDTALHPPPCCGTYGYERWTPAAATFPAVGGTYLDPIFGETLTRVTNIYPATTGNSIIYGINGRWNADSTAYLHQVSSSQVNLINPQTGATIRTSVPYPLTTTDEVSFDPVDPDIYYYTNGVNLTKYSISGNTSTTVKTFGATLGGLGQSGNWIDKTGHYFLLNIGGNLRIWHKQTDTLYTNQIVLSSIQGTNPAGGIPPGYAALTPDGLYVIGAVSPEKFSFAVDHGTTTLSTTAVMFWDGCTTDHVGAMSASDGFSYVLTAGCLGGAGDPTRGYYRVRVTNNATALGTGQYTLPGNQQLLAIGASGTVGNAHMGCAASGTYQDWCWASVETPDDLLGSPGFWYPYKSELLMIHMVSPFEVRRMFHHRARPLRGFCRQARVNPNWSGTKMMVSLPFSAPDSTDCGYSDLYRWDAP